MADYERVHDDSERPGKLERTTDAIQSILNDAVAVGDDPKKLLEIADQGTREVIRAGGHLLTYSALPIGQARELLGKIGTDKTVRRPARVLAGSVQLTRQRGYRSQTRRSSPVVRQQLG